MHDPTRGNGPCVYPDGHTGQHRTALAKRKPEAVRRWNRGGGVAAAQRYRNRHPVRRALTIVKSNAARRVG